DLKQSTQIFEQSLALYKELGDKIGQIGVSGNLIYTNNRDIERSKNLLLENLKLCRELGHLGGIANCLGRLSLLAIWEGDFSSPIPWLDEVREILLQLGDEGDQGNISVTFAFLAYWQDNYEQAISHYNDAITMFDRLGETGNSFWAKTHLAYAVLMQGDIQQAKEIFENSIRHFKESGSVIGVVYALEGLASLNVMKSDFLRATQLFAWADAIREKIGDKRPPVEQGSVDKDLEIIHSEMDDVTFDKLWKEGSKLTTEEAIDLAMKETTS
ncbi:MAG TPA: tetratricopeptide repeat protein, partial [Anaerolineales bacterium]|nr:tetratricopeptide repeat protein [Anaerolineales bacterium]